MNRRLLEVAIFLTGVVSCAHAATEIVLRNFQGAIRGSNPQAGVVRDSAGNLYGTTTYGGTINATCPIGCGVVYKIGAGGHATLLYSFSGGADGRSPQAGVVLDSKGNLYGTTTYGGPLNPICNIGCGVVYKIDAPGHETVLYSFMGGTDGLYPMGGLTRDAAGNLYGTTYGGPYGDCFEIGCGVAFKLDSTGHETTMHLFGSSVPDGTNPSSGVTLAGGRMYGTAQSTGGGAGAVYKLDSAGNETVLYGFTGGTDGGTPVSGVVLDAAGNTYGTTYYGGMSHACAHNDGCGVVYKIDASGHETVLYTFTGGADGGNPSGGVVLDSMGNLYGTTSSGGNLNCNPGYAVGTASGCGVVYKLDSTGHETVLYSFSGGADGGNPYAGVIRDSAGNLYGTTQYGGSTNLGVVYKLDASGHETVIWDFAAGTGGWLPYSGVTTDSSGNLYGTTYYGGAKNLGVVYKVDSAGHETVLHSFTGVADGASPLGGVTLDTSGNLYATASRGGTSCCFGAGGGVVYKLDAAGNETVLHAFAAGSDGDSPASSLVLDATGTLYGTNSGVVFKLNGGANEVVLHTFAGSDGISPSGGLIQDGSGNLYGTTYYGGIYGQGVLYRMDTAGHETVLYNFLTGGIAGGISPQGNVAIDAAGNIYGITRSGGTANANCSAGGGGCGVVYKVDALGNETVLYSFAGGTDGAFPQGGVILDSAGNLYGTTQSGGAFGAGVVYKVDAIGNETVLYSFTGGADGGNPYGVLIRDAAGNLYGTTQFGGTGSGGVLFKIELN